MGIINNAGRLWALEGAQATIDASMCLFGSTGAVGQYMPSFLIEHDRGLVLFDTGFAPEAAGNLSAVYGEAAEAFEMVFEPEQRLDAQLESRGFTPNDVKHVILSHAHWDHTGGAGLFPHAQFYLGAGELEHAYVPMPFQTGLFRRQELDLISASNWYPMRGDLDLFGDGSIQLLSMPGHTPGNYSLLVNLEHQAVVLSGDTVHLRAAYENPMHMPADCNATDAVNSIRRLKQVAAAYDALVWVTHDPDDWDRLGSAGTALD